jgi:hypothetical protein
LTAADETQLAGQQAQEPDGRSDAENEGVWKWVTGPEAELPLEDSLTVQLLSQIISPFGILTNPTSITELKKIMLTSPHLVLGAQFLE